MAKLQASPESHSISHLSCTMEGERVSSVLRPHVYLALLLFLPLLTYGQVPNSNPGCPIPTSSCGRVQNISYPFLLEENRRNCSHNWHELTCQGNSTPIFHIGSMKYHVLNIFYENKTLRLVDHNLSSSYCTTSGNVLSPENPNMGGLSLTTRDSVAFLNCSLPLSNEGFFPLPCGSESKGHYYFHVGLNTLNDLPKNCRPSALVPVNGDLPRDGQFASVQRLLQMGFELSWSRNLNQPPNNSEYLPVSPYYYYDNITFPKAALVTGSVIGCFIILRTLLGVLFLFAVVIFILYRKLKSKYGKKELLDHHAFLGSSRYPYSDIKKITDNFKEKLGQGGYGAVFKGKLPNGQLVAVKVLDSSKGNGEEFINEVCTIGRINHINVVRLIGFCLEGPRSALVYEFMPNGSLDKYIFSGDDRSQWIHWEKLYEIALGVARGIEYLHRGCEMRILHFDIKPHNILLDENFNPKVSDFGLAKLFSLDQSIVSISTTRGTAGYIAPELFSTNFGGVSYKSDVYSFGMLLLEMAGRRKNYYPLGRSSQIYFPTWVYDELNLGKDLEIGAATEVEKDIAMKLVIIGLWCIQIKPNDRPSMSRVVEMLEQSSEELEMPPKPFLSSPERLPIEENSLTDSDTEALLVE